MKKILALLLAVMLVFAFAACGAENEQEDPTTQPPTTEADGTEPTNDETEPTDGTTPSEPGDNNTGNNTPGGNTGNTDGVTPDDSDIDVEIGGNLGLEDKPSGGFDGNDPENNNPGNNENNDNDNGGDNTGDDDNQDDNNGNTSGAVNGNEIDFDDLINAGKN